MANEIPLSFKRISSRSTLFYKWIMPVGLIVVLLWLEVSVFTDVALADDQKIFNISTTGILILFIVALSFFSDRHTLDRLYRDGDHLLAFCNGSAERVELSDIESVIFKQGYRGPSYAYLRLKCPTRWGKNLKFIPLSPLFDDSRARQLVEDLDKRAKQLVAKA